MGCFQSKTHKESQVEDAERAEKAAEFLTQCKSGVVEVPGSKLELHYCSLSLEGVNSGKPNQDSFCINPQLGGDPNAHLFGVFDGHGTFGGECAEFVKDNISHSLVLSEELEKTDTIKACKRAFEVTNSQLHVNRDIDDSMSGTTAVTVMVKGDKLHVANVGDSRAIIAQKKGKQLVAVNLSTDQIPYREDEYARIQRYGGVVMTQGQVDGDKDRNLKCWGGENDDGGDPPRVWILVPSMEEYFCGSAFTRSMGDKYLEAYGGVIAEPEVNTVQLTPQNPFFVIASDGVTQFISSQAIVDTIAKYKDLRQACSAIGVRSYFSWLEKEGYSDDITVIIVQIKGLKYVPEGKSSSRPKGILNWRKLCTTAKVGSFQGHTEVAQA